MKEDPTAAIRTRILVIEDEPSVAAFLRTALERGEIASSIDPAGTAALLVAISQGLMVVGKANPETEVLYAIVDTAFAGLHGPAESNP